MRKREKWDSSRPSLTDTIFQTVKSRATLICQGVITFRTSVISEHFLLTHSVKDYLHCLTGVTFTPCNVIIWLIFSVALSYTEKSSSFVVSLASVEVEGCCLSNNLRESTVQLQQSMSDPLTPPACSEPGTAQKGFNTSLCHVLNVALICPVYVDVDTA